MSKEEVRREAVSRYMGGERAAAICAQLGCSRRWLMKWVGRWRGGGESWFCDRSRRPRRIPSKTDGELEQVVIETRRRLEQTRYALVGALTIAWELERLGVTAPPGRTIARILKRHGLVRKSRKYVAKGKDYPAIDATGPHQIHQMDIVGPRFLAGDGRFYAINVMDVFTGKVTVSPTRRRTNVDVLRALLDTWQRLAIPRYLQMDNELPFRGSNRHPRSFGIVIRLCLHLGIQPVFIPLSEPWRNGTIERFQDLFDKGFFRAQDFQSFEALVQEAGVFENFHNQNHRYSTRSGRTPNELEDAADDPAHRLAEGFELPEKLFIEPGRIHLMRFIRSDRVLDVFGIKFNMPAEVVHEYVTATIDTAQRLLTVTHDNQAVYEDHFPLPKTAIESPW